MSFGGMKVIISPHAVKDVPPATYWVEPRFSQHRSKRLWKKLRKRTSWVKATEPSCYQMGDTLVMHPQFYAELNKEKGP